MAADGAVDAGSRTPGRAREVETQEVINAVRYLVRSGCGWGILPIRFGHRRTGYGWLRELARRFLFQAIHDIERMLDRELAGCEASPMAAVIDSQPVKASQAEARAYDAGKKASAASGISRWIRTGGS